MSVLNSEGGSMTNAAQRLNSLNVGTEKGLSMALALLCSLCTEGQNANPCGNELQYSCLIFLNPHPDLSQCLNPLTTRD